MDKYFHQKIICVIIPKNIQVGGLKNGYGPSTGFVEARQAVADYVSVPSARITADDVILCSGCR